MPHLLKRFEILYFQKFKRAIALPELYNVLLDSLPLLGSLNSTTVCQSQNCGVCRETNEDKSEESLFLGIYNNPAVNTLSADCFIIAIKSPFVQLSIKIPIEIVTIFDIFSIDTYRVQPS